MCGGVQIGKQYTESGKVLRIYFPNLYARLPVRESASAEVRWIPWGRREGQGGVGPRGGWARDDSITAGKWARSRPIDCLVPVEVMMERAQTEFPTGSTAGLGDRPAGDAGG